MGGDSRLVLDLLIFIGLAHFHMPLSYPKEDNEEAICYTRMELREVVQAGYTNVGIVSIWLEFQALIGAKQPGRKCRQGGDSVQGLILGCFTTQRLGSWERTSARN